MFEEAAPDAPVNVGADPHGIDDNTVGRILRTQHGGCGKNQGDKAPSIHRYSCYSILRNTLCGVLL